MKEVIIIAFFAILGVAILLITLSWRRRNSRDEMLRMMREYHRANKDYFNQQQ